MAVLMTQHVRAMRGGAQGHLMLGEDDSLYVVKFQNNPQTTRVLANDFMATRLAQMAGLSVPECDVVEVTPWLVKSTAELRMRLAHGSEACVAGLQFGSRYVGGLMPGQVVDYLAEPLLLETKNLAQFAGMLVIDKWTCNVNGRQAVFCRKGREKRYTAVFIDQGYCFNAAEWTYRDVTLRGVFPRDAVYAGVTGWASFEPWLSAVEEMDPAAIWQMAELVPPDWYGGDLEELEKLVEGLIGRRKLVRGLIEDFRDSDRRPFPAWVKREEQRGAGWMTGKGMEGGERVQ